MSPGSNTESYPAFARIGLRENQVTCPDRDSNPGHLVSQPDALTVTPQDEFQAPKFVSMPNIFFFVSLTLSYKSDTICPRTLPGTGKHKRPEEEGDRPKVLHHISHARRQLD
ncbi:hypothetical protein ANN_11402 [Periplaneta americana]|uniref:Uncharacterized protein n=1 Tax=Periplaneta americana TaxID=6978 RepID=A0ABQ8T628_PERAM|nr:hypothetical protein ANN_11402 [Periplaneta americana]